MFISEAYAQAAGEAAGTEGLLFQFLPLILIFVVFYFLLIRPQQRKMKDHRSMLSAIRRGDRIVTGGGIIGTVVRSGDDELTVEIGDGVRVKVMRSTVASVLAKPEPAKGRKRSKQDDDADDDGDAEAESSDRS